MKKFLFLIKKIELVVMSSMISYMRQTDKYRLSYSLLKLDLFLTFLQKTGKIGCFYHLET